MSDKTKLVISVPHVIVDSGSNIAGRLIPKLPLVGSHWPRKN